MKREELIHIIDNNPLRLRESYFINNFLDIYKEILDYTNNLDLPFKQRLWHYINQKPNYIICKVCSNRVTFHKNWLDGYREYCSTKCSQTNPKTKEKRKETTIRKWGVDNIAKLYSIKEKQAETNLKKYGTKSTFQNEKVKSKWRENIKEKYGVEHIFQLESSKNKAKSTSLEKWGTEFFVQSESYKKKLIEIGFADNLRRLNLQSHIDKYLRHDLEYITHDTGRVMSLISKKCGHSFDIHYDSLKRRIDKNYECCTICNPINSGQSQEEILMVNWLRSLGVDLIEKDRSYGIELDILIPSKKVAIEFNGLYWHSELYKGQDYHLKKSIICRENSIRLIHIWEDDWMFKKDIVKSIILNSLGIIQNKIFARKCQLKSVHRAEKDEFLDENHIQGKCVSGINLGLYYDEKLVSLMTFGKRHINGKEDLELLRFCNKKNYVIIGAASKLFNYFVDNYKFSTISSFADVSQFTGGLYEKLGFKFSHRSKPNYWWVVDGLRHHRFNFNKKRLVKEGCDPSKTEVEIMYDKGHFRIFGCGQDKYIFTK